MRSAAKRMGALIGIGDGVLRSPRPRTRNKHLCVGLPHGAQNLTLGDRVIVQVNAQYQPPLLPLVKLPVFLISSTRAAPS
jgi:hypothetical protein